MSQETVEIVQRLYEATARRDAEAASPLLDPEVEWDMSGVPFPGLQGVYRGRSEVFAWWLRYYEAWAESGFEILRVVDAGEEAVVVTRAWGEGQHGIEVDQTFATVVTVGDGQLRRQRAYLNVSEALEAVGLSE
jgi:ketosteroid isomerase-like protein